MSNLSRYWKTVIAVVGVLALFVQSLENDVNLALLDGHISNDEWYKLLIAAVVAVGVFAKRNTPPTGEPRDPDVSEADH